LGKFMGNQLIADSLRLLADGQIGRVVFTEDALRQRDANATPTPATPTSSPPTAANAPASKKATL
jgi:hypothetical protein